MFTLNDICQSNTDQLHIQSSISPDPALVFRSAHHDSRLIAPGDLVLLKGSRGMRMETMLAMLSPK